jgi:hypothetical protein
MLFPAKNAAFLFATNQNEGAAEAAFNQALVALSRPLELPADVFAPP